jgi:hypothetical protein
MAKNLDKVNVLTDTFNAWVLRTNDVIETIRTEVLTANTAGGVTGASGALRNARLWGAFTANNLNGDALALGSNFVANSSSILIGPSIRLYAGPSSSNGAPGQVLSSTTTGVRWADAPGTGTLTNITSGNGVSFFVGGLANSNITTTGTVAVRAGSGVTVNTSGVSVNTAYLNAELNPIRLLGQTWANPGPIGLTTTANANFTDVTATGYKIFGDTVFDLTRDKFQTPGYVEATTPSSGAGIRVRLNDTGTAAISFVTSLGAPLSEFRCAANGQVTYSNNFVIAGLGGGVHQNVEIGYKTIPQIAIVDQTAGANNNINYTESSGAHYIKSDNNGFTMFFPNSPCPIGTAITFVNDPMSDNAGNISLVAAAGITLQLAGAPTLAGPRIILPGGVGTALKVRETKWIVSGSGVT